MKYKIISVQVFKDLTMDEAWHKAFELAMEFNITVRVEAQNEAR